MSLGIGSLPFVGFVVTGLITVCDLCQLPHAALTGLFIVHGVLSILYVSSIPISKPVD
jgi:hypothetical protein